MYRFRSSQRQTRSKSQKAASSSLDGSKLSRMGISQQSPTAQLNNGKHKERKKPLAAESKLYASTDRYDVEISSQIRRKDCLLLQVAFCMIAQKRLFQILAALSACMAVSYTERCLGSLTCLGPSPGKQPTRKKRKFAYLFPFGVGTRDTHWGRVALCTFPLYFSLFQIHQETRSGQVLQQLRINFQLFHRK